MATVNGLPDLEMIRDSYVRQIHGEIRELQEKKGVFGDRSDPLYMRGLKIIGRARSLPEICLREDLTPAERDELIRESIQWLSAEFSSADCAAGMNLWRVSALFSTRNRYQCKLTEKVLDK